MSFWYCFSIIFLTIIIIGGIINLFKVGTIGNKIGLVISIIACSLIILYINGVLK